jgi:hypothetical protein
VWAGFNWLRIGASGGEFLDQLNYSSSKKYLYSTQKPRENEQVDK